MVEGLGVIEVLAVLVEHRPSVEGVGVRGVEFGGGVEVFQRHVLVAAGIEYTEFLEGQRIVGVFVADAAEELHGAGRVALLLIDIALHEECRTVVLVLSGDFGEVLQRAVVVLAVEGNLAHLQQHLLVVGCHLLGVLQHLVAVGHIAVLQTDVALEEQEIHIVGLALEGLIDIHHSLPVAPHVEEHLGAEEMCLEVVRLFLQLPVEGLQFRAVRHIVGNQQRAVISLTPHRQRKNQQKYISISLHYLFKNL